MNRLWISFVVVCCVGSSYLALSAEGVVVVMSSSSSVSSLSKKQVKKLYLGRSKRLPGGGEATILDYSASESLRKRFYENVVGKYGDKLDSYWLKLKFTGKGQPPKRIPTTKEMIDKVSSNASTVGYIPSDQMTKSLKVVFTYE